MTSHSSLVSSMQNVRSRSPQLADIIFFFPVRREVEKQCLLARSQHCFRHQQSMSRSKSPRFTPSLGFSMGGGSFNDHSEHRITPVVASRLLAGERSQGLAKSHSRIAAYFSLTNSPNSHGRYSKISVSHLKTGR